MGNVEEEFSDALEFENYRDSPIPSNPLSSSRSMDSLVGGHTTRSTADSEASTMSTMLETFEGVGQPPQKPESSLTFDKNEIPKDAHPLYQLALHSSSSPSTANNPIISSNTSLVELPSSVHNNPLIQVKTKAKGKLISAFKDTYLIQQLKDDEFPVQGALFCLCFSPDGHFLAAAGADKVIRIWRSLVKEALSREEIGRSSELFEPTPVLRLRGHLGEVLALAWSHQTEAILSASIDGTVRLWHSITGTCLGVFPHGDVVSSIAFHPKDERLFISGCLDCRLRLWSIGERCVKAWNELPSGNHITAVAFSQQGNVAMAGTSTGFVLFFHTENDLKYQTQLHVRSQHGKNKQGRKISSIFPLPSKFGEQQRVNFHI